MIPKDSTPVKNKILIDIIAKGLLNKDEMRIIAYIIRWSWGFDNGERRQDWTKELNITKIAKDINIGRPYCNRLILRMIKENKIIVKNERYQFNEHCEGWIKVIHPKDRIKVIHKVDKSYPRSGQNLSTNRIKVIQLGTPNNQGDSMKNKDVRGGEHLSKKTLKETKTKEKKKTLSQPSFLKEGVVYQLTIYFEGKIRENNRSVQKRKEPQIQSWCKDMDYLTRIDKANPNEIKKIIDWVVEDKFWAKNVLCPASLRKHYPRFYKEIIDRGRSLEEKIATDHRLDDVH